MNRPDYKDLQAMLRLTELAQELGYADLFDHAKQIQARPPISRDRCNALARVEGYADYEHLSVAMAGGAY